MNAVPSAAYMNVLAVQASRFDLANTSAKLPQFQAPGHSSPVSAWSLLISAVSVTNATGPRNISDSATATACRAIQWRVFRTRLPRGLRWRTGAVAEGLVARMVTGCLLRRRGTRGTGGAG